MFAKWEGTKLVGKRNFNFKLQEPVTNVALKKKILPKVPHSGLFKDKQSYSGGKRDYKNMKLKLL